MQIALLSWESVHSIHVGGLGAHVTELGAALQRCGHEVHIITRLGPGQTRYECIEGVHYHRCPVEPHSDFLAYIRRMCDAFSARLEECERFYDRRFDVIHGHDWLAAHALVRVKNVLRRPVVLTMHSTEFGRCGNEFWDGESRRIRDIEWEGTYVANRVICVSGALRNETARIYNVPTDKMHVVYNGVDVQKFSIRINRPAIRKSCFIGSEDPMVLFAGRLARQKGPDLLMEAIPEILDEYPTTKFVFAGDGDMRHSLESKAHATSVAHATRFLGYRTGRDLIGLFKTADVVCVPSRNEPFGIVILEAWCASKPVVATRNGGPGEFIRNGETGLTVSADADGIGEGLAATLADAPYGRRLGNAGRLEAESRFSWDIIARETENIYAQV